MKIFVLPLILYMLFTLPYGQAEEGDALVVETHTAETTSNHDETIQAEAEEEPQTILMAGGESAGGGAPKVPDYGRENMTTILASSQLKIELLQGRKILAIEESAHHEYRIDLNGCTLKMKVQNGPYVQNPKVISSQIIYGCRKKGSPKPASTSPLKAILENQNIREMIGFDRDIFKLESKGGDNYVVSSAKIDDFRRCTVNVHMKNESQIEATKQSDCDVPKVPRPAPKYVGSEFKDYFKQYDKLTPIDFERPYREYVEIAKALTPEKRKTMIEFMRDSNDKKYQQVYSANAQKMAEFMRKNPDATTGQFYLFLGNEVMNLNVSEGFVMPVLNGLNLAPLFITNEP